MSQTAQPAVTHKESFDDRRVSIDAEHIADPLAGPADDDTHFTTIELKTEGTSLPMENALARVKVTKPRSAAGVPTGPVSVSVGHGDSDSALQNQFGSESVAAADLDGAQIDFPMPALKGSTYLQLELVVGSGGDDHADYDFELSIAT